MRARALRQRAHQRRTWANRIAQGHDLVGIERLQNANMRRSPRGNNEQPGQNVRSKSGLNRRLAAIEPRPPDSRTGRSIRPARRTLPPDPRGRDQHHLLPVRTQEPEESRKPSGLRVPRVSAPGQRRRGRRRSRSPARRGVHQGRGQPVLGDRSGRPKSRGGAQEGRKGQGGWDRPTLDHARNASAEAGQKPVRRCNTSTVRPRHDAKLCANRGATYGFPDTPSRPRRARNRRRRRRRGERQERADAASVATIRRGTRGRSRRLNGTARGAEPGLVAQPLHGPDNQVRALNASGDDDRTDSGLDIGKQAGRRPLRQPLGSEGTGIGYEEHAASRLDRTVNPRRGPRQSEQGRARPANEPRQSSGSGLQ